MERNEIFERVTNVFRDDFDDEELVLSDETTAADIEDWDSLTHITLITAIESEFAEECDCGCCGGDCEDDFEYYEIDCPTCGETICIDEDFFDGDDDIVCPKCGETIEIDVDDDEIEE